MDNNRADCDQRALWLKDFEPKSLSVRGDNARLGRLKVFALSGKWTSSLLEVKQQTPPDSPIKLYSNLGPSSPRPSSANESRLIALFKWDNILIKKINGKSIKRLQINVEIHESGKKGRSESLKCHSQLQSNWGFVVTSSDSAPAGSTVDTYRLSFKSIRFFIWIFILWVV